MPSDRDLAQQWLAEQLHSIRCGCGSMDGASREDAAAILDTPGVEVREQVGTVLTAISDGSPVWVPAHDSWGIPATHRRLVILLPAEPITEGADHDR